jgi:hypothetical protein
LDRSQLPALLDPHHPLLLRHASDECIRRFATIGYARR